MFYRKNISIVNTNNQFNQIDKTNKHTNSPPTVNFHKKKPLTKQTVKIKITHRNIPEKKKDQTVTSNTEQQKTNINQSTDQETIPKTNQDLLDIQRDIDNKLFSIIND